MLELSSLKPYLFQLAGRGAPLVLGILVSVLITRYAGVAVFGQWALAISLATILFGVLNNAVRLFFQRSSDALQLKSVVLFQVRSWLVLLPVLLVAALGLELSYLSIIFMFSGFFFQQLVEAVAVKHRMQSKDFSSIIPRSFPVLLFVVLLFLIKPEGLADVGLAFCISWLSSLIFLFKELRGIKQESNRLSFRLKSISPIWLSLLLTQAYGNLDLYIIKYFHDESMVGTFRLSYTFASMVMPIAGVFSFIFLSNLSLSVNNNRYVESREIIKNQILINLFLASALIMFNAILLPIFSERLYGDVGLEIIEPAVILSIAMLFNILSMTFSYALLAVAMERAILRITIVSAFSYFLFSVLLIPNYQIIGAAIAMVCSQLLSFLIYLVFFCKSNAFSEVRAFHS